MISFFKILESDMCSLKRDLKAGEGDQSTAGWKLEFFCSKDLNKFTSLYFHIMKDNIPICLYGESTRDGKLLPKVKQKGRTLPWKNIMAALSREDVQNCSQKALKTGKRNVGEKK